MRCPWRVRSVEPYCASVDIVEFMKESEAVIGSVAAPYPEKSS